MMMIEFTTQLLPHQQAAVEKLRKLKVGALYMEQGTGKTRTALELISIRLEKGKIDKVLWLCPCSVKDNLVRDIEKHTGSKQEDLIKVCGIESLSSSVRLNSECLDFVENNRVYLVIDESLLIKTFWSKRTKHILNLSEKCTYKLILNGTPISKNEADLFAQWYVLDWRILGYRSWWSFSANHLERDEKTNKVVACLNTGYLTDKIAPYTYQVKKADCLTLPEKHYRKAYYELSAKQMEHYNEVADMLLYQVDELKPSTIYRLFSGLQDVISGLYVEEAWKDKHWGIVTKPIFENPFENPRIQALLEEITPTKTIIFCKYTHEIVDVIRVLKEKYGEESAIGFYGEIKPKQRQQNINTFEDSEKCLFLVANKACAGFGLNLQFCHKIIYYSNDWTLGTRLQSEDRVHRIGQEEDIEIIDIIAEDTLDERILDCLIRKTGILSVISSSLNDKNALTFKEQLQKVIHKGKETIEVGEVIKENLEGEECAI